MATLDELLVRSSRTFAVGIELLPGTLRHEVTVAYLLLRVSDYLEDTRELTPREKIDLLDRWRAVLGGGDRTAVLQRLKAAREDTPDALVARNARTVLAGLDRLASRPREIVTRRVAESTAGMARWTRRGSHFHCEADLDDYMHEVAGRVGLLLTELFALRLPAVRERREQMLRLGREFGLGLQTVNVIRGLHEDPSRGWVYVPRSFVPDRRIFDPRRRKAAMAAVSTLAQKADRHLEAAKRYICLIPRRSHRVRLFCALPLLFAVRTLALSRRNPAVLDHEVKMTRPEVAGITRAARLLGRSNRWLRWYCRRLAATPAVPPA